jgi:hypothetical protein
MAAKPDFEKIFDNLCDQITTFIQCINANLTKNDVNAACTAIIKVVKIARQLAELVEYTNCKFDKQLQDLNKLQTGYIPGQAQNNDQAFGLGLGLVLNYDKCIQQMHKEMYNDDAVANAITDKLINQIVSKIITFYEEAYTIKNKRLKTNDHELMKRIFKQFLKVRNFSYLYLLYNFKNQLVRQTSRPVEADSTSKSIFNFFESQLRQKSRPELDPDFVEADSTYKSIYYIATKGGKYASSLWD